MHRFPTSCLAHLSRSAPRPPSLLVTCLDRSLSTFSLLCFLSHPMEAPSHFSPITAGGDSFLSPEQIGSAPGSLKNDGGLLSGGAAADGASGSFKSDGLLSGSAALLDSEFGFQRAEIGESPLVGTVGLYERHVFLCYKSPDVWPSHVEAAEFDRLPRLLSAALATRKPHMKKKTRLTICEGEDGTESSNGDVLIFPDMIRYRRLTHFDVDNFVEEVLVKDTEWLPGAVETMMGSYVFVCAHGSRDKRCGVCGPVLIKRLKEEINSHGLQDQVFVSACSHIGGHKYAGNVIIFNPNINGEVTGHWYGYVTPDDVPILLEQHIGKGEIVDHLWRGQMGLSEEGQKEAQNLRFQLNGGIEETSEKESMQTTGANGVTNSTMNGASGCCQGVGNSSCCQNMPLEEKAENNHIAELETREFIQKKSGKENRASGSKGPSTRKVCRMPTWFETWEREDTYAAVAVVAAVASVAVAYSFYRQLK